MVEGFDRIVIAVPNVAEAASDYEILLGQPALHAESAYGSVAWFGLGNTTLELRQAPVERSLIHGLVLHDTNAAPLTAAVGNPLDLQIEACDGSVMANLSRRSSSLAVDHLVLRSSNAGGCIDFFSKQLGIRLALDKTAPQWGGRMLFFRAGKMTLEVIESSEPSSAANYFWGLAFKHASVDALHRELTARGVECSPVRDGRKPGTRVVSIQSHCLGIPTLLIQPSA